MKVFPTAFAIALCALAAAAAADDTRPPAKACASEGAGYPRFCSIPAAPTNVPSVAQFHRAVQGVETQGQDLKREAAESSWSLPAGAAAGFAAEARESAAPPPPMTSAQDAAEFARRAREAATPPPRAHPQ